MGQDWILRVLIVVKRSTSRRNGGVEPSCDHHLPPLLAEQKVCSLLPRPTPIHVNRFPHGCPSTDICRPQVWPWYSQEELNGNPNNLWQVLAFWPMNSESAVHWLILEPSGMRSVHEKLNEPIIIVIRLWRLSSFSASKLPKQLAN